jgi:predicted nucleotide-binding protein
MTPSSQAEPSPVSKPSKEYIFIVHGHNRGIRETVARFIEHLGAEIIILDEQPNQGRTIIEKFEMLSNAAYAVVLMTADDIGGLRDTPADNQVVRARQNVIIELGYMIAKLGRSRISVLYQKGVEIPSDISGVLSILLDDAGAWKFALARELKTSGIKVDLNKII